MAVAVLEAEIRARDRATADLNKARKGVDEFKQALARTKLEAGGVGPATTRAKAGIEQAGAAAGKSAGLFGQGASGLIALAAKASAAAGAFYALKRAAEFVAERSTITDAFHAQGLSIDLATEAAGGLISQIDLMATRSRLANAEIEISNAQYALMAGAADTLGDRVGITGAQAIEKMADAIEQGNTRSLKSIGILVDLDRVVAEYAAAHGKAKDEVTEHERQTVVLNATLDALAKRFGPTAQGEIENFGDAWDAAWNKISDGATAAADAANRAFKSLAGAPKSVQDFADAMVDGSMNAFDFGKAIEAMGGDVDVVRDKLQWVANPTLSQAHFDRLLVGWKHIKERAEDLKRWEEANPNLGINIVGDVDDRALAKKDWEDITREVENAGKAAAVGKAKFAALMKSATLGPGKAESTLGAGQLMKDFAAGEQGETDASRKGQAALDAFDAAHRGSGELDDLFQKLDTLGEKTAQAKVELSDFGQMMAGVGAQGAAAFAASIEAVIAGEESFGAAMAHMARAVLSGLAQQAAAKAIFEFAEGLALVGIPFVGAVLAAPHFAAAKMFGLLAAGSAVAAGGVGAATGGGAERQRGSAGERAFGAAGDRPGTRDERGGETTYYVFGATLNDRYTIARSLGEAQRFGANSGVTRPRSAFRERD